MTFMNNRKMGKIIPISMNEEEGEEDDYRLTFRQSKTLLQITPYLRWITRHATLPTDLDTQAKLDRWVSDLELRLMKIIEPINMSCEDFITCIQEDEDVKEAIRQFIYNDTELNQYFDQKVIDLARQVYPTTPIANSDTLNQLWAQCLQITDYTAAAIFDLCDVLETQSNNIELISNSIQSIPILRIILEAVPIDAWLNTADYFLSIIGEQFASGWTETIPDGLRYKIACELFCICRDDQIITVERIWTSVSNLLDPYTTISWDNISELVESIVGVNDNSEAVALAAFAVMWGAAKLANVFGLTHVSNAALSAILEIAKDDASNDWETICDECNEPDDTRTPVIDSNWDEPNIAGTLIGPDIDGYYTVTATSRGTDWAFVLMDIEGRDFVLEEITYSFTPTCQVFLLDEAILYIGCDSTDHYTDTTVDEFWSTFSNVIGEQSMTFKMRAP